MGCFTVDMAQISFGLLIVLHQRLCTNHLLSVPDVSLGEKWLLCCLLNSKRFSRNSVPQSVWRWTHTCLLQEETIPALAGHSRTAWGLLNCSWTTLLEVFDHLVNGYFRCNFLGSNFLAREPCLMQWQLLNFLWRQPLLIQENDTVGKFKQIVGVFSVS